MSERDPIFGFRVFEDPSVSEGRIDFCDGKMIVGRIEMSEARDPIEAAVPQVVLQPRSTKIADLIHACARGELPFSGPGSDC